MKLKTVLLAGASLLAMTSHAWAFTAIGSAVISVFLAVGLGGLLPVASAAAIGLATVGLVATAAQVALNVAMLGRRPSVDPNRIKTTTQGQEGPGRYAFGRVRLGGKLAFGDTAEYDIYRLLLNCFGPVPLIEEYYYDNLLIDVDVDGKVVSPPWISSGGNSNLFVQFKQGDGDETAWSDLVTDFPDKWTADHKVQGIAQLLLHALNPGTGSSKFLTLFQGGIKELEIKARAGQFYDPRDGSTQWSMNGVLHCLHWFRQLPGITDDIIDFDAIGIVATAAEVNVDTLTGTAPRCQLSGGWEGSLTYDIVLDMLQSAGLEVRATAEGKYTFAFIEDDPESELTLYDRHIIDREIYTGDEAAKRANVCTLKFFSPERQYEVAEIDLTDAPWAKVDDEIDVYGEQEDPITLTFCTDASQAQRIARRLFHMRRADKMALRTTFAGLAAWGKSTITVEIPDVGEDGASIFMKCRKEGGVRVNDGDGTCEIALTIIPDVLKTAWDTETDEVAAPPVLEVLRYQTPFAEPSAPSLATVVEYPDGKQEVRAVFASVSSAETAVAQIAYEVFIQTGTSQSGQPEGFLGWGAWADIDVLGLTLGYEKGGLIDGYVGKKAQFRCGFFDENDEFSGWSGGLVVDGLAIDNTKPSAPLLTVTGVNGNWAVDATIPNQPRIAWARIEKNVSGAGWVTHSTHDVRPDETVATSVEDMVTSGQTIEIRAFCFTSNDTASDVSNVFSHTEA